MVALGTFMVTATVFAAVQPLFEAVAVYVSIVVVLIPVGAAYTVLVNTPATYGVVSPASVYK